MSRGSRGAEARPFHGISGGDDARLVLWSLQTLNPELYLQLEVALAAVSWTGAGIAVGGVNGVTVFDLR